MEELVRRIITDLEAGRLRPSYVEARIVDLGDPDGCGAVHRRSEGIAMVSLVRASDA